MTLLDEVLLVTVQSANRPENVTAINDALEPIVPLWVVPESQAADYASAGAKVLPVQGELPMKPKQLNAALTLGWASGRIVVTMDDDYVSTKRIVWSGDKVSTVDISLYDFILQMLMEFTENEAYLAGVTTNLNPFWGAEDTADYGMITGQILFHKPNSVKFDTNLPMMEDLDLVLAHHVTYGRVMKVRRYVQEFHMMGRNEKSDSSHTGGYATLRNEERLALAVDIMNHKYRDVDGIEIENNGLGNPSHKRVNFRKVSAR